MTFLHEPGGAPCTPVSSTERPSHGACRRGFRLAISVPSIKLVHVFMLEIFSILSFEHRFQTALSRIHLMLISSNFQSTYPFAEIAKQLPLPGRGHMETKLIEVGAGQIKQAKSLVSPSIVECRPGQLHEAKGCHLRIQACMSHIPFWGARQIRVACGGAGPRQFAAVCSSAGVSKTGELLYFPSATARSKFFPRLVGAAFPAVLGLRCAALGSG